MTTAMMMRINVTLTEIDNMLYHDFKNRYMAIAELTKKANSPEV